MVNRATVHVQGWMLELHAVKQIAGRKGPRQVLSFIIADGSGVLLASMWSPEPLSQCLKAMGGKEEHRNVVPTNIWSVAKPVYDLEYADDTLLMAQSAKQLQSMVHTLEDKASKYGLKLNKIKTVCLTPLTTPPATIFLCRQHDNIPVTDCVKNT